MLIGLVSMSTSCIVARGIHDSNMTPVDTNLDTAVSKQHRIQETITAILNTKAALSRLDEQLPILPPAEEIEKEAYEKGWREYERLRVELGQLPDQIIQFGEAANPAVLHLLHEGDVELRAYASYMLGEINKGKAAPDIVRVLVQRIPDEERAATLSHMGALFKIGHAALPALLEVLEDGDPVKRPFIHAVVKLITGEPLAYYDPQGTQEQRKEAVQRIRQWLQVRQ